MKYKMQAAVLGLGGAGMLALAACSSSGGARAANTAPMGGSSGTTVDVRSVGSAGNVLTDAQGHTLYASEQEAGGKVMCTSQACTTFWQPVLAGDSKPTGPSSLTAKLTTITRPDGKMQVALNGDPLYTFTEEHGAGQLKGDGFKDNFGGQHFTWHVATPTGVASQAPAPSSAPTYNNNPGY